jgi:hypothetical protein
MFKRVMLKELAQGKSPTSAAEAAGIGRATAYKWRSEDPEFAQAWNDAVMEGIDRLEDEAYRRAVNGVLKPVYQGGKKVGHIRQYSDGLMALLLRGRRPEVYARPEERSIPHVNKAVMSVEDARARLLQLGLPLPLIEGDYEELDAAGNRKTADNS